MTARLTFGLVAIFWVVMNVLLWRVSYGPRDEDADAVPVALVWKRILTAPDSSSLTIWKDDKRVGFGHWISGVGEELAQLDEAPPEGVTDVAKHYHLNFDGNIALPEEQLRLRFEAAMKLATNRTWQEFSLKLTMRPLVWELRANAAEQSVRWRSEEGDAVSERVFTLADLQNPQALLAQLGGPAALGLLAVGGVPTEMREKTEVSSGIRWEASSVYLTIGREPIRVYRLQTRLLDRYVIRIFVSRAGEILRVELPNGIMLRHDQLGTRAETPA